MRLHKVEFQFRFSYVKTKRFDDAPDKAIWNPTSVIKDVPLYDGPLPKRQGKRYPWLIGATYAGHTIEEYTFLSPSQVNAKYFIKKAKEEFEKKYPNE
jgi:hypothetical protein